MLNAFISSQAQATPSLIFHCQLFRKSLRKRAQMTTWHCLPFLFHSAANFPLFFPPQKSKLQLFSAWSSVVQQTRATEQNQSDLLLICVSEMLLHYFCSCFTGRIRHLKDRSGATLVPSVLQKKKTPLSGEGYSTEFRSNCLSRQVLVSKSIPFPGHWLQQLLLQLQISMFQLVLKGEIFQQDAKTLL